MAARAGIRPARREATTLARTAAAVIFILYISCENLQICSRRARNRGKQGLIFLWAFRDKTEAESRRLLDILAYTGYYTGNKVVRSTAEFDRCPEAGCRFCI